jgi:hypothetical protein
MSKLKYIILLLIVIWGHPGWTDDASTIAGTSSILLLRFGPNPRVAGLSEAFSAVADDETALFYNPAGLSNIKSGIVSLSHTEWFEDIRIDNIAFGYEISRDIGIGAGLTHMWMPGIEGKNSLGQSIGSIDVSSSVANLGVSYNLHPALSMGLGVKYFQDKLASYSASGVGFDLGFLLKTFISGLSTGLSVQNIGGGISYDKEKQKIPLTIRGGLAYKIYSSNILISLDVVKSIDTDVNVHFGAEYILLNQFSISIGNRFSQTELFTPAFGAGFHFNQQYHLYYTFANYENLGGIHRMGFSFYFKSAAKTKKPRQLYSPGTPVVLIPPPNLSVEISGEELHLAWNRVAGVQYNVYAKHSSQEKWSKLNKSTLYNNSMQFKKPLLSGTYFFRVSSVYNGKESSYSKEVNINVE